MRKKKGEVGRNKEEIKINLDIFKLGSLLAR